MRENKITFPTDRPEEDENKEGREYSYIEVFLHRKGMKSFMKCTVKAKDLDNAIEVINENKAFKYSFFTKADVVNHLVYSLVKTKS